MLLYAALGKKVAVFINISSVNKKLYHLSKIFRNNKHNFREYVYRDVSCKNCEKGDVNLDNRELDFYLEDDDFCC